MNSGIMILRLPSSNAFLSLGWETMKLFLKTDEPQFGQRTENVERKQEYYRIIFKIGLEILHQEERGQMNTVMIGHFNRILFHKSELAHKHHFYPAFHGAMGCSQKSFMLVWQRHQLMSMFQVNGHLPPSIMSFN